MLDLPALSTRSDPVHSLASTGGHPASTGRDSDALHGVGNGSGPCSGTRASQDARRSETDTLAVWMLVPVPGVDPDDLRDTFSEMRGARYHAALDIPAPRGTPVVAAEAGRVQKIWESKPGGHTVYVLGATGRFRYYYAHLEGYRPGLREGELVKAGEVIGYVGDSGNARPGDTHLHFGLFLVGDPDDWSGGTAINPLPYLRGERPLS
jgi:murein DD-endopeptidase MepM/ murein hydrolase activator NlpD